MALAEGVTRTEVHGLFLFLLRLHRDEVPAMAIQVEGRAFATWSHAPRAWVGFRAIVELAQPRMVWFGRRL